MRQSGIREWNSWGGPPARIAACALGVTVAVVLVVLGAVLASVAAVAVASLRGVRGSASRAPTRSADLRSHPDTPVRLRPTALQRAAADEAAR